MRLLATIPRGPDGQFTFSHTSGAVGNQVIYTVNPPPWYIANLFAVPITGGPVVTLAEGPEYEFLGAVVGSRVVYHRCPIGPVTLIVGPCDVYSVQSDGSGTIALSTHPDYDAIQGAVGSWVVVRRNHGGPTDELFSVLVTGGVETPILTLAYEDEFMAGIAQDRILLQRTTGLWSIKVDGSELTQLAQDAERFSTVPVGPFACFNRGVALWCVPADGSGPATKVTDHGTFVAGL